MAAPLVLLGRNVDMAAAFGWKQGVELRCSGMIMIRSFGNPLRRHRGECHVGEG